MECRKDCISLAKFERRLIILANVQWVIRIEWQRHGPVRLIAPQPEVLVALGNEPLSRSVFQE
jgi:hypothetical protein